MGAEEKVIVRQVGKPKSENVDSLVSWFCKAFGLSEDKHSIEQEILKEITAASLTGNGLTSKELAQKLEIPRTTTIYHINRLISIGLATRRGRRYLLREADMESTIEAMQADIIREFERMLEFADMLDKMLIGGDYGGRKERRSKK
ncbi:MAG: winged helix-turn-helix transcriptional regulator [Candidatus Micrarchaeaceae archaeon]